MKSLDKQPTPETEVNKAKGEVLCKGKLQFAAFKHGLIGNQDFIDSENFILEYIDRTNFSNIVKIYQKNDSQEIYRLESLVEDVDIRYYDYYYSSYPNKFTVLINWTSDYDYLINTLC